ncbi:MAG: P-loop NTPase [Candidatus Latescibacterota bacterium]|nr:P-loop NTPase [Candidatus Latescibacterota bacterium]
MKHLRGQFSKHNPIVYPVASGKGGTGKSTIVSNFGAYLALKGYNVVIVDCDFGGSDLHLFLDVPETEPNLSHYLNGEVSTFPKLLLPTCIKGLKIICGGNEMIGMAYISEKSRNKLINELIKLDADVVLIDLGAGAGINTLEFFSILNNGIVVCTPEPHSRINAYGLIKNVIFRSLNNSFGHNEDIRKILADFVVGPGRRDGRICDVVDAIEKIDADISDKISEDLKNFNPCLILNRVRKRSQIGDINNLINIVRKFLSIELTNIGFIRSDSVVLESCQKRSLFVIDAADSQASVDLRRISDFKFK